MPFSRKEKMFSVSEYAQTVEQDCSAWIGERIWKCTKCNVHGIKSSKRERPVCAGQKEALLPTWFVLCHRWWAFWKTCEVVHKIYILLNFSFKFWWINVILLNIKPV